MKSVRNKIILMGILLLGLSFRIYDLRSESLWMDEGISIRVAHLALPQLIEDRASRFHTPLYFIILHCWVSLFGDSEFCARLLSVIFGFFTIFMAYKLGRLIFDKNVGILASLLLALSTFHIYYSQEARMYSLLTLLTLCSFYFFIRLFKEKSFVISSGYIVSSILLIYTHYTGLFIIIVQNVYYAILFFSFRCEKKYALSFKKWFFLQLALVVLFLPWIKIAFCKVSKIYSFMDRIFGGQQYIAGFPTYKMNTIIMFFHTWASSSVLLLCLFLFLFFFSIIHCEKSKNELDGKVFLKLRNYKWNIYLSKDNKIYLLLAWLFIPVVLVLFLLTPYKCWPKYTIAASLAFYFLVAKGIDNIKHNYVKGIIIGAIIALSLINIYHYNAETHNEQWREAVNYIDTHIKPDDLLLFLDLDQKYIFDYYSKRANSIRKRLFEKNINIGDYAKVWVIQEKPKIFVKDLLGNIFGNSYKITVYNNYSGMDTMTQTLEVYLFEKNR